MASLTQNPISFPWSLVLDAQRMKNQNQQDMFQNIQGMGQGLGQIGQDVTALQEEKRKKAIVDKLVTMMQSQGQPQLGPQQPGVGTMPPGVSGPPVQPTSGMGAPPVDNTNEINALGLQYDPNAGIKAMFERNDPLKKAQTAEAQAKADYYLKGGKGTTAMTPYQTQSLAERKREFDQRSKMLTDVKAEEEKLRATAVLESLLAKHQAYKKPGVFQKLFGGAQAPPAAIGSEPISRALLKKADIKLGSLKQQIIDGLTEKGYSPDEASQIADQEVGGE